MTHCLVVDDDPEIRASLQLLLQRFGMSVALAASGREMRERVAATCFDVVVLDLMLPDENGLQLCRWVQQHHDMPVIMLTAHGDPASRVLGLEMGADDYLGKPVEPREPDGIEGLRGFVNGYLKKANPALKATVRRVVVQDDLVVLHVQSVSAPGAPETAIVDIFRVENAKLVEHWDVMQQVPEKLAHDNTMF